MVVSANALTYDYGELIENGKHGDEITEFARERNLEELIRVLEKNASNLSEADQFALIRAYYRLLISGISLDDLRPIEKKIDPNHRIEELNRTIDKLNDWIFVIRSKAPELAHEIEQRKKQLEEHLSDMKMGFSFRVEAISAD